jgi:hypothetical protein
VKRNWNARAPSASAIASSEPDAGRPITPPLPSWSVEEQRDEADMTGEPGHERRARERARPAGVGTPRAASQ